MEKTHLKLEMTDSIRMNFWMAIKVICCLKLRYDDSKNVAALMSCFFVFVGSTNMLALLLLDKTNRRPHATPHLPKTHGFPATHCRTHGPRNPEQEPAYLMAGSQLT